MMGPATRSYHVLAGNRPVLGVALRPGHLYSMAPPTPGFSPPAHPFVDAFSHAPEHEHDMRLLLLASHDGRDFLRRLIAAGYDIAADIGQSAWLLESPAWHICRRGDPVHAVAAMWPHAGAIDDPFDDAEPSACGNFALTIYDPAFSMDLKRCTQGVLTAADLVAALEKGGFQVSRTAVDDTRDG